MQIRRFTAPTMHQALRRMSAELGPDAVILSNETVAGEVVLVGAVDYDAALLAQAAPQAANASQGANSSRGAVAGDDTRFSGELEKAMAGAGTTSGSAIDEVLDDDLAGSLEQVLAMGSGSIARLEWDESGYPGSGKGSPTKGRGFGTEGARPRAADAAQVTGDGPRARQSQSPMPLAALQQRLDDLTRLVSGDLLDMVWSGGAVQASHQPRLAQALLQAGFDATTSRELLANIPDDQDPVAAAKRLHELLARRLELPADGPAARFLSDGGVVALHGPAGAGKTSLAARLAAHFASRHGAHQLVLVSLDSQGIASRERIYTIGQLLGVAVRVVSDGDGLRAVLEELRHVRGVIVDTAGVGLHEVQRARQCQWLTGSVAGRVCQNLLVLPAHLDGEYLDCALAAWQEHLDCPVVLTHMDECQRVGRVCGALLRHDCQVLYAVGGRLLPGELRLFAVRDVLGNLAAECGQGASPATSGVAGAGDPQPVVSLAGARRTAEKDASESRITTRARPDESGRQVHAV